MSWKEDQPPGDGLQLSDVVERLRSFQAEALAANEELHQVLSVQPRWLGVSGGTLLHVANLGPIVVAACERAIRALDGEAPSDV